MSVDDSAIEVQAQGWRTLAALHNRIEAELERALQDAGELSVVEFTMLSVLGRQPGSWHMRMQQVSRATALSPSATTRLVTRLEKRGLLRRILCDDDRRGIYTELTQAGAELLGSVQPAHERALRKALQEAREVPELALLVDAVTGLAGAASAVARSAAP
ncbi:MarR family winged helix-turn-helix transcriptional regulator [Arthrobacter sp. Ld5]|uniref:MarR family winged helix-turn-helix transcriptional regulator n=1 Tax=Arthrobacter sp. Ld5 TaxID=649152 RepID=UPI003EC0EC47